MTRFYRFCSSLVLCLQVLCLQVTSYFTDNLINVQLSYMLFTQMIREFVIKVCDSFSTNNPVNPDQSNAILATLNLWLHCRILPRSSPPFQALSRKKTILSHHTKVKDVFQFSHFKRIFSRTNILSVPFGSLSFSTISVSHRLSFWLCLSLYRYHCLSLFLDAFTHRYKRVCRSVRIAFLGSGPDRGRSPVEMGDFTARSEALTANQPDLRLQG